MSSNTNTNSENSATDSVPSTAANEQTELPTTAPPTNPDPTTYSEAEMRNPKEHNRFSMFSSQMDELKKMWEQIEGAAQTGFPPFEKLEYKALKLRIDEQNEKIAEQAIKIESLAETVDDLVDLVPEYGKGVKGKGKQVEKDEKVEKCEECSRRGFWGACKEAFGIGMGIICLLYVVSMLLHLYLEAMKLLEVVMDKK